MKIDFGRGLALLLAVAIVSPGLAAALDAREFRSGDLLTAEDFSALWDAVVGLGPDVAELQDRVDGTDKEVGALQDQVIALQGDASDDAQELTRLDGAVSSVQSQVDLLEPQVQDHEARLAGVEDRLVRSMVIDVGAGRAFTTLPDALASLADVHIAADAAVTVRLDPGTYTLNRPVVVDHPDGARLHITGDVAAPGSVVLSFTGGTPGLVLRDLAELSGMTVRCDAGPACEDGHRGVRIGNASSAHFANLVVDGWSVGIEVADASHATTDAGGHGPTVVENGTHGVVVAGRSVLGGGDLTIRDNAGSGLFALDGGMAALAGVAASNNDGHGFLAYRSGGIVCDDCRAEGNALDGFRADSGAYMELYGPVSTLNQLHGYRSDGGSTMNVARAVGTLQPAVADQNGYCGVSAGVVSSTIADFVVSTDNGLQGLCAWNGGTVQALTSTLTGNVGGDINVDLVNPNTIVVR